MLSAFSREGHFVEAGEDNDAIWHYGAESRLGALYVWAFSTVAWDINNMFRYWFLFFACFIFFLFCSAWYVFHLVCLFLLLTLIVFWLDGIPLGSEWHLHNMQWRTFGCRKYDAFICTAGSRAPPRRPSSWIDVNPERCQFTWYSLVSLTSLTFLPLG